MFRLGSIAALLAGLLFAYYSYDLSLGQLSSPGPGLWPFLLASLLVLLSLIHLIREKLTEDYEGFTKLARFVGYGAVSLVVFTLLFERIGFTLPAVALLVYWLRFLGKETWKSTLINTIVITAVFYIVFVVLFKIPFPDDLLLTYRQ
ncbi:tripartite tricarboxylate transporter TctB family protein [Paenibacillus filicis]|uniref:tripartite tricarboxylate transporter TctB family protein n=1 Tax=Paenibacillus filicis TaxID=669464 RepID=UPI00311A7A97